MTRKVLALFIALMLCGTAQAEFLYRYYEWDSENMNYSTSVIGHLTEDSFGKFQKGSLLKEGLTLGEGFMAVNYKGQNRLLYFNSESKAMRIYKLDDLSNPITSCDIPSLNLTLNGEAAMWGDNVLLAGDFGNGTSGIVEINPQTGAIVNRYVHENSTGCSIEVYNRKIYAEFSVDDGSNFGTDYAEMSSVGVISNNLANLDSISNRNTSFDINNYPDTISYTYLSAVGNNLYVHYAIQGVIDLPSSKRYSWGDKAIGYKGAGIIRLNEDFRPSSSVRTASFNTIVTDEGLSGTIISPSYSWTHDGKGGIFFYATDFEQINSFGFGNDASCALNVYYAEGSGQAKKIYTVREYTSNPGTQSPYASYIGQMFYDTSGKKLLLCVSDFRSEDNYRPRDKLIVLSHNSGNTFTVSQELDGISAVLFVESSSENDEPDAPQEPDSPGEPDTPTPTPTPTPTTKSGGGGCSAMGTGIFAALMFAVSAMVYRRK